MLTGSTIRTASTVSAGGSNLTIAGNADIDDAITNVGNLSVSGTSDLGANVTTTGTQTYTGAVTLSGGARNLSGSTVSFASTVAGGANDLTVTGNTSMAAAVTGLGNLSVTGSSTVSADVTTTGNQTYSGALALSGHRVLTGSTIRTASTVSAGGSNLTIAGNADIDGAVSSVGNLSVSGTSDLGANVTTTGTQTYTGAVTLSGGARTLTGTTINTASTIAGGGNNLSIVGNADIDGVLSNVGSLSVSGTTAASVDVTTTNNQTYASTLSLSGGDRTLTGTNIHFDGDVNNSSNITVVATGNIAINGTMTATNSMVRLDTTGKSTEEASGKIIASSLALKGSGGNHTLNSVTNNVSTIAADTGRLSFVNAGALTVGTVNPVGITATGPVSISTVTGNLTISQNITTTDTSTSAIVLNAGTATAAGTSTGGDILLSGSPTISTGSGGRATFYSGSVSNTTSVAALVSAGNFRYGSNASSANYTKALGAGNYLIYRERPSITLTGATVTRSYDGTTFDSTVSGGYTCTNCVNSEGSLVLTYTGSAEGAKDPGGYVITPSSATHSALGYSVSVTNGSLSIGAKTLQLYGSVGLDKVYDGRNSIYYGMSSGYSSLTGIAAGDEVYVMGAPVYSGATVGAKSILQGTVTLGGSNASKYSLAWNNGSGNITAAPLTVRIHDDARFSLASDTAGYNGYSISGFVNGETAASVLSGSVSIGRSNAGTNTSGNHIGVLVNSGSTLAGSNYNITYVPGNYTIVGAGQLKVVADNTAFTYGGTAPSYNVTSLQYVADGNVTLTLPVTANGNNRFSHSSLIAGNISFTLGPGGAVMSTSNHTAAGIYQLAASNATISNPLLSKEIVVVGAQTVNPKELLVNSAAGVAKMYDSTVLMGPNLTVGISGNISGDVLSATGIGYYSTKNVSRDASGNVLSNISYTVAGLRLSGADAGNYYYTSTDQFSGSNGKITPAPINAVYVGVVSKKFDGNMSAKLDLPTASFEGVYDGDLVTLARAGGNYITPYPGRDILVNVGSLRLGGTDANNYYLNVSKAISYGDITGIDPKAATADLEVVKSYNWNITPVTSTVERPAVGNLLASTGLKYERVDSGMQPLGSSAALTSSKNILVAGLPPAGGSAETVDSVDSSVSGKAQTPSSQSPQAPADSRKREIARDNSSMLGATLKVLVVEGGVKLPEPNDLRLDRRDVEQRTLPRSEVELLPVPEPELLLQQGALDVNRPLPR
ncbi:MAG: hypothetical protein EBV64_13405 [Oxalobacteraceae bacterium]|nr:hypothetical protein [Oxalobacteraceae bacterium]